MKCPNCGEISRIRENDKFCHKCGFPLKSGAEKNTSLQLIRSDSDVALKVYGNGYIPVSDYKFQSSADGETELCVTFKGVPYELDLKMCIPQ